MFDWSSIPDEIKRIIFNYCKLDRKLQIKSELIKLKSQLRLSKKKQKFDSFVKELKNFDFDKNQIRYTNNNGILIYSCNNNVLYNDSIDSIVGMDININKKMLSNIDNFCYNCKKNSTELLLEPYEFVWYNPTTNGYKNNYNKIYVCYSCYFIVELLDSLCNMPQGTTIDNIIDDICFCEGYG